jgi:CHAT domain-containing protein
VGQFGALDEAPVAVPPSDPLLRSGLLLAGAKTLAVDASGPAQPRLDSALATALELSGLNLWGTQLVVLSACDTGRGDIQLGQGVFGLRKVNDETTRSLMEAYYTHLLAGRGRASALRQAMLDLRATQPHPYYWAPFISLGSGAPLRTLRSPSGVTRSAG